MAAGHEQQGASERVAGGSRRLRQGWRRSGGRALAAVSGVTTTSCIGRRAQLRDEPQRRPEGERLGEGERGDDAHRRRPPPRGSDAPPVSR